MLDSRREVGAVQSRRDGGITALVEGVFAAAWFGWGHAAGVAGLEAGLDTGSTVAVAALAVGLATAVDLSAVPGAGAGCCLLVFGGYALARAVLPRRRPATS